MKANITQLATLYSSVLSKKKKVGDLIEFIQTEKNVSIASQQRLASSIHTLDSSFAELEQVLESLKHQGEDISLDLWERRIVTLRNDMEALKKRSQCHLGDMLLEQDAENKKRKQLLGDQTLLKHRYQESFVSAMTEEKQKLLQVDQIITTMMGQGQSIVKSLVSQSWTLKRVQRTLLDCQTSLGTSNAFFKLIFRRDKVDRLLIYCGMLLTFALFLACYYLVHAQYPGHTTLSESS